MARRTYVTARGLKRTIRNLKKIDKKIDKPIRKKMLTEIGKKTKNVQGSQGCGHGQ